MVTNALLCLETPRDALERLHDRIVEANSSGNRSAVARLTAELINKSVEAMDEYQPTNMWKLQNEFHRIFSPYERSLPSYKRYRTESELPAFIISLYYSLLFTHRTKIFRDNEKLIPIYIKGVLREYITYIRNADIDQYVQVDDSLQMH